MSEMSENNQPEKQRHDYAEFEIGHSQVPWFLWVFFILIVTWAFVSWMPLFGY